MKKGREGVKVYGEENLFASSLFRPNDRKCMTETQRFTF